MDKNQWDNIIGRLMEKCPLEEEQKATLKEAFDITFRMKEIAETVTTWPKTKELQTDIRNLEASVNDTVAYLSFLCIGDQPSTYIALKENGTVNIRNSDETPVLSELTKLLNIK